MDETVVAILKYSKNRMAVITCSLSVQLPNDAIIMGTKGTVRVGHQRLNKILFVWANLFLLIIKDIHHTNHFKVNQGNFWYISLSIYIFLILFI